VTTFQRPRPGNVRLATYLGTGLVALVVLVACAGSGSESGDGWQLESVDLVEVDILPELETFESTDGVGVSVAVETSTGGVEQCDLPVIDGSRTAADNESFVLVHQWPQRGCADQGVAVFNLVIANISRTGTIVLFKPKPEGLCMSVRVFQDGSSIPLDSSLECPW